MLEAFERLHLTSSDFYTQLTSAELPQRLREPLQIRRLDSFVVCNFKSFRGTVFVGPLLEMTSVVGPNGAGKSNLLDAMMFCFCNEKTRLTYYDLREFIHRSGSESYAQMADRRCSVQARFLLADGRVLTLERWLTASEREGYLIDGEEFSRPLYESFLLHCHVHHSAVNYAVWQGEVDKLLLKDPREVSGYFDQLSGSACFREEQLRLQREVDSLDEELTLKGGRLLKFRQERKSVKNLETFRKAKAQIVEEYQTASSKLVLLKAYVSEIGLRELEGELETKQKQEQAQIRKHNELKAKMQRDHAECSQLETRCQGLRKELAECQRMLRSREQSSTLLQAQEAQELGREVMALQKYLARLKEEGQAKEEEVRSLHSTDVSKEYLQLYGQWEGENEAANRELVKRREEYLSIEGILQGKRAALHEFQAKQEKLNKNREEEGERVKELRTSMAQVEQNTDRLRREGVRMVKESADNRAKLEETEQRLAAAYGEAQELENILTENIDRKQDAELVRKLKSIEGFKGILEQWVKPTHRKFELCFRLMLAPLLKYLLCQNETAARFVSLRLKENLLMRTVVILDNVSPHKEQLTRTALGKTGTPALEAVEFDKSIDKLEVFLRDALRGKVICDNLATAYQLLRQNIRGLREIYTLEGEVLGVDGMVETCGSYDTAKKYRYLNSNASQARVAEEMAELQKKIHRLTVEVEPLRKGTSEDIRRNNAEIDKLQARKEELAMKLQLLENSLKNKATAKLPKGLEKEIEELSERSRQLDRGMKAIEEEMARSPIFADFLKAHHTDVDSFRSLQDIGSLEAVVRLKTKLTRELQEITHQIIKIGSQVQAKTAKWEQLKKRVQASESEDLPQLKLKAKGKQAELDELQLRLSELKSRRGEALVFKSEVPQTAAKLTLAREMHLKLLKEEIKNEGLREKAAEGDYSLLEEAPTRSVEALKSWGEELQKEREKLEGELDRYNMNIANLGGDVGSLEDLKRRTEALKEDLEGLNDRKVVLISKLAAVKQDRRKLYLDFLDQLKPVLSRAYDVLTENGDGYVGKIDVSLENPAFPCDRGLYLHPVPPGKRYTYDLGQLSGGEKSMVSLALHYAIAVASRSSFLVLDETDAFLDKYNVARLFRLISHSLAKKEMQFVLITHKHGLFLQSQSLVGLCRPQTDHYTKAYSLKLQPNQDETPLTDQF